MNYQTIREIQSDLLSNKISVGQLVNYYLEQIKEQSHLNCFLEVYNEEVISSAKILDDKLKAGQKIGKLFGLVIALKDNIVYKNHHVSASSKILKGYVSPYSATVVERLLAEDAIIIGRTNCDEFAMGSSNENSAFGPVLNPIDNTRVPGGSSGGSAAAVKANLCHAALGSDTGGSIRQPASFCDIIGFKPSYGSTSRYGLIAYASSFDQIGPFTKSVDDQILIYETIAGKDPLDATTANRKISVSNDNSDKKYTIAFFPEILESEGISEEVKNVSKIFLEKQKALGHTIKPYHFKYMDYLIPIYYVLTTAEASSNLARFDGVRYGHRHNDSKDLEELYVKSRSEGFGPEVKRRIMLGTFVLSSGFYDAYYTQAQKVRRMLHNEMSALLKETDFLFTPTCPSVPFKIGEKTNNPIEMYFADLFTVLANIVGMPAITLPLYKNEAGLPIAMQIMSNTWEEEKLFQYSQELMKLKNS